MGHIIWPSLSICGVRWISILIYRTSSNRLRLYEFIELTWGKIGDHRLDTSNIWGERFITPPSQRHFEKGFTKASFQIDAFIPACDWLMRLMLQSYWRGAPPSWHQFESPSKTFRYEDFSFDAWLNKAQILALWFVLRSDS